jgi:hypothetical protein
MYRYNGQIHVVWKELKNYFGDEPQPGELSYGIIDPKEFSRVICELEALMKYTFRDSDFGWD